MCGNLPPEEYQGSIRDGKAAKNEDEGDNLQEGFLATGCDGYDQWGEKG